MEKRKNKVGLIINPVSGRGEARSQVPSILSRLQEHFSQGIECYVSQGPDNGIEKAVLAALSDQVDVLVLCGGDGTFSSSIHQIYMKGVESEVIVGHLPFGTCSDITTPLHIPHDLSSAIDCFLNFKTTPMDVWKVKVETPKGGTGLRYFTNIAGIGFTSSCVQQAARLPGLIHGMVRYIVASAIVLPFWKNQMMEIQVDDTPEKLKGLYFSLNLCNGSQNGGGIVWAPLASITDGLLNIHLVGDITKRQTARILGSIKRIKTIPMHPLVREFEATRVVVSSEKSLPVECDGDIVGLTPATFSKAEQPIRVISGKV